MLTPLQHDGARTVAHLAIYFAEMKEAGERLYDEGEAGGRGYFRPEEELRVRQLQASYWQSRAALLELIEECRREAATPGEADDATFLIAFAAAVLLVDAGRYLREHVHDHKLLRHKLDEPCPELGIPARSYAQVQKSLTSPRHAWYLYHALKYFDQNRDRLGTLAAAEPELAPAWAVADRLGDRLRVSAATYAETRLRDRGRRLGSKIGRGLIWRAVYGLQKLACSMAADRYVRLGHQPALPDRIRRTLSDRIAPGDVLVVRKEHALTNYFLPGYWPHAALYLGTAVELARLGLDRQPEVRARWERLAGPFPGESKPDEPRRVLESMKDGVRIRSLGSPAASDSIVVLRPQLADDHIAAALARGLSHEGKPYDFDFDFRRADRLVCTEVVYRTYDGVADIQLPLTERAGRQTLSAGDLVDVALAGRHFKPIAAFVPARHTDVAWDEAAASLIRDVLASQT